MPAGTESVGRKSVLALEELESIGRYHVMKVTLAAADRAVTFANPVKVCSDFELHATAVTRAAIGSRLIGDG